MKPIDRALLVFWVVLTLGLVARLAGEIATGANAWDVLWFTLLLTNSVCWMLIKIEQFLKEML